MNLLLDNTKTWLNELGIPSRRVGENLFVELTALIPLGLTPDELIVELRKALNANNMSFQVFETRIHIYSI
jgi:hypothetical protein